MEEKKKSGLATSGVVLGIIAICLSFIPILNNASFIMGALATIFGLIIICNKKFKKGKAITALILGVLSIIITLSLQAQWGKALDNLGQDIENSLGDMSGDNTATLLKTDVDISFGKFVITKGDYFDSAKLTLTVKNKTSTQASYSIQIEALDSNGNRLDTDTVYATNLNANQSQTFDAFTLISSDKYETFKNATFRVVSISKT